MAVMRLSTEMGAVKARLELLGQQLEEGVSGEDGSDRLGTVERGLADLERAAEAVEARMMQRLSDVEKHLGALTTRLSVLTDRLGENDESLAALRQHLDGASAPPLRDEGADDDLTAIKGIGPKYETALKRAGVRTYRQIAEWSDDQVVEIAAKIGTRPERIRKADWMGSARALLDG
jgi:predicted flap endonuclease-1-like 5' DNA nuclease